MKKVRFVGLDVHADTIAVAVASRAAALPPRNEVGAKRGHHARKRSTSAPVSSSSWSPASSGSCPASS